MNSSPFLMLMLMAALLLGCCWQLPTAYPLFGLFIYGLISLGAIVFLIIGRMTHAGLIRPNRYDRAIGSLPVICVLGSCLWMIIRWYFMTIHSIGYDSIISELWFVSATLFGCGVGAYWASSPPDQRGKAFREFCWVMVFAAYVSALMASYQYFIGYPSALHEFRESLGNAPIMDWRTFTLIQVLRDRRVGGGFGNPNLFAVQLSIMAIFCLCLVSRKWFSVDKTALWMRVIAALGLIVAGVSLWYTRSRGGVLTFGWIMIFMGIFVFRSKRSLKAHLMISVGLCFWMFHPQVVNAAEQAVSWWARITDSMTIRERFYYWDVALKMWEVNPLMGAGVGSFQFMYMTLKDPQARETIHAHSWFFHSAAELGLIGVLWKLVFWGSLFILLIRSFFQRMRLMANLLATPFLIALAILCINGLFELTSHIRTFCLFTGMFTGIVCAFVPMRILPDRRRSLFVSVLGILMIVYGFWFSFSEAMAAQLKYRAQIYEEAKKWDVVQELYAQASSWMPQDSSFVYQQAAAILQYDSWSEKVKPLLEHAQRLNPHSASIPALQSRQFELQGDLVSAVMKMDEAIMNYPSSVTYRLERIRLNLELHYEQSAWRDLEFIYSMNLPIEEYQKPLIDSFRKRLNFDRNS